MTPDDLARLKALLADATGGEWALVTEDDPRGQPVPYYRGLIALVQKGPEGTLAVVSDGRSVPSEQWAPNGQLLVAAVKALPQLIATIEEQRARLAAAEAALAKAAMALHEIALGATGYLDRDSDLAEMARAALAEIARPDDASRPNPSPGLDRSLPNDAAAKEPTDG